MFFKNYCDNNVIEYKAGDILQKGKIRYEYVHKNENGTHRIKTSNATYPSVSSENLRKYAKVNAKLSNRKVKTGFKHYKKFFNTVFPGIGEKLPFEFKYKAAIILEKNPFSKELKEQSFTDIDLNKAIPFQWVNKNGKFENPKVPIDPMIYMAPDYETIKDYIIDEGIEIETVIVIGKNKYKDDDLHKLTSDLRLEEIPFSILIGSEKINDVGDFFLKWNWSAEETAFLNDNRQAEITTIPIGENEYIQNIYNIENFIKNIKTKYSFELPSFSRIKKLLYSLSMPDTEGRIISQINYIKHLIKKEFSDNIENQLYTQNIDPTNTLTEFNDKIKLLFDKFENTKFHKIEESEYDYLVVPDFFEGIWESESNYETLSFKEFKKRIDGFTSVKTFLFISLFGYKTHTNELLNIFRTTYHNYNILSFPEEIQVLETLINRHLNNVRTELCSKERKEFSGIKFTKKKTEKEPENIVELIGRIKDKNQIKSIHYSYDIEEPINFKICYTDGSKDVLEGNKSVLIENNHQKRKLKVSNLKSGDIVRVYSNLRKEILFKLATDQDKDGVFTEIERFAQLWKNALREFLNEQNPMYSVETLLSDLQNNNISINSIFTLKNWLDTDNSVKFPQKTSDFFAIDRCINKPKLHSNLNKLVQYKKTYNGIMIALGRDLSDEVMNYVLNNNVGKILAKFTRQEINSIVNSSAPLKTVKDINITDDEETERQY